MSKKFIPQKLYRKFIESMPLCCLDLVVVNNKKFLLVKRKYNPVKDKWWFPGGRVFFGENLTLTAKRKLKEELGIKKAKLIRFLGTEGTRFRKGYFNSPTHTINSVFLTEIDDVQAKKIKLDLVNHFDYKWLKAIPKRSHPYLKKILKLAGFK